MDWRSPFDQELAEIRIASDSEIPVVQSISESVSKLGATVLQGLTGFGTDEHDRQR